MACVDVMPYPQSMTRIFSGLRPRTLSFIPTSHHFISKPFYSSSEAPSIPKKIVTKNRASVSVRKAKIKVPDVQLKENWLASLSYPLPRQSDPKEETVEASCVIGIDPDLSGALAIVKHEDSGSISAEVFDSPHLEVLVGRRVRKRLDVRAIVQLLQNIDAPIGTTAYIEQSIPYPQDGKQGWWSGGFGYGLWIGVLVASGFSVVPVPSAAWKNEFNLSGNGSSKDDSRRLATMLFPSLSSQLKRKKDHGRAEALLIAAYGKGMKIDLDALSVHDKPVPSST